ncbi:hydrogenase maturation protein [Actinocatenispora rupis]|uniref:Formyl transferase n=1 Tax=Actinocatenispora rupis TaxID=519421 RepID=A0A8J3ND71_9ACTN|nr:enoyl-CoA hydratase-related protein [Actinocatenispora rupis]GID11189.1 formyl transferase [Actinocatenispora rupis]
MRLLLLVSAFNGLTQRLWDELRERGHDVAVEFALDERTICDGVYQAQPDLILCPYLKERVPAEVWTKWRTVIIHPGPVGDRGPSSLDYAIAEGAPRWGVTALSAVEEMDAGPIWAHREFDLPADPPRKSALYTGPVADAAIACALEVVERAADPDFVPTPLAEAARPIPDARLRPLMKQAERAFDWSDDAADIIRKIRAADGFPGVRTELAGVPVNAFDAHPGTGTGRPGEIIGRQDGYVLVAAGTGAVWLGHLRQRGGVKLPAATVLREALDRVPVRTDGPPEISYRRRGPVGELTFRFYNGAAGVDQCRRLRRELHRAARQDTRVLVLRGGPDVFCNGVHLTEISAAADPAAYAWENIKAINLVCRELIEAAEDQVTIAAFTGNAGAGGVMLGLGADVVAARAGVVLNPYYDIGLYGSELHSYALPRRVGIETAERLLSECLPVGAGTAARLGMVDLVGPGDPATFDSWLSDLADQYAQPGMWRDVVESRKPAPRPLDYHETLELAEMARDIFDDRSGFVEARESFVRKVAPVATPAKLAVHRR